MSGEPLLAVRGVDHGVLHGVELLAEPATLVALTGHSGSGKSTLCHLVAGLERPERGTVTLEGTSTADVTDWSRISVVPQRLALLEQLTGLENLALPVLSAGLVADPQVARAQLDALGVSVLAERPVGRGSIGEQQRVAVARALILPAALIVLDEPTAHQDDENAERVVAAITAAVESGSLLVISTHDPRLLRIATLQVALGSG